MREMKIKKIILPVIIFCVVILINSCDPGGKSTTEIINNSYYDLSINMETYYGKTYDINIAKGETAFLDLFSKGGYPSPNQNMVKIVITDMNTGEPLKLMEIDADADTDIFTLLKVDRIKRFWYYQSYARFSITITDEFLWSV